MLFRVFVSMVFILLMVTVTACAGPVTSISRIGYSIQVGAFSNVHNAERLTAKLQDKGIEAFYFRRENGLYAVRFGDFPRHHEAYKAARKLVSDRIITSYFIADPQKVKLESPSRKHHVNEPAEKIAKTDDMGSIAARTAERFVGIPYRWGGNTVVDGMDCSGFARAVYNLCGVNIPRTSGEQFRVGKKIDRDELQDGDLVFFGESEDHITHVGIYIGNNRFVHAPRRGEDIRISTLTDNGFGKRFMGGRRYF
jgi:uncharacterized protein YycO